MSFVPLKTFYDRLVTNEYRTGDIWSNLPTHGLLKASHLPGIVITPACDLANEKVETITYLPIISIRAYLATTGFLPELKGSLLNLSAQLKYEDFRVIADRTWPPTEYDITRMLNDAKNMAVSKNNASTRLVSLLEHLAKIVSTEMILTSIEDLSEAFGNKNFEKILGKIITNNYRNDIHFLPADNQDPSWAVVKDYSVVLFRYPLTAPIEVFDLAQTATNWQKEIAIFSQNIPYAKAFDLKPVKTICISQPFLHDLLNRFVTLYSRLGSPDFTTNAIERILDDMRG